MTLERTLLAIVFGLLVLGLLLLMARSWRRRGTRDGHLSAYPVPAAPAAALLTERVAYVATTKHGLPLERLLPRGLRFRAQGTLSVAQDGLTVTLAGSEALFMPAGELCEVSETTWAIDRAVETDGLSCVSWRMNSTAPGEPTIADSYFRVIDPARRAAVVTAISHLISAATTADANSEAHK